MSAPGPRCGSQQMGGALGRSRGRGGPYSVLERLLVTAPACPQRTRNLRWLQSFQPSGSSHV